MFKKIKCQRVISADDGTIWKTEDNVFCKKMFHKDVSLSNRQKTKKKKKKKKTHTHTKNS